MGRNAGPVLIALAALGWATDTLFRYPLVNSLDPTVVVFCEHVVGVLALLPYLLLTHRRALTRLKPREWLGVAFIGAGGSALASIFFTASFRYINPSITILLQKLQPILVVLISVAVLGERPPRRFFGWATLAIAAAIALSFPDLNFSFLSGGIDLHSRGVINALAAAALWAVCTVMGKAVLRKQAAPVVAFWRYVFGFGMLCTLLLASSTAIPLEILGRPEVARSLLYMGLIPGVASMLAYYFGLARTEASVATFVELVFPVSAITLNAIFLHALLTPFQVAAAVVLILAVTQVSSARR
ncbi:MAG: DMT family transporter [Bdellovibrionota bacterium]